MSEVSAEWLLMKEQCQRNMHFELQGTALVCGRTWDAWSVGTMTEADFSEYCDDSGLMDSLTEVAAAPFIERFQQMEEYLNVVFQAGMQHAAQIMHGRSALYPQIEIGEALETTAKAIEKMAVRAKADLTLA